jgi:DNA-binding beta-propeller fold protein YncE
VIYIIKENRTYDQILGDLPVGNGDPDLTEFGQATTPNLHSLAQTFVTLDNFYDRSEVSMDGWPWSVSARSPDVVEKQVTVNYAGRGLSNDSEGTNRNINVSLATLAQRLAADPLNPQDPDLLPGTADASAPDGPEDQENTGYLWNAALRAGLSIRNYGFFIDLARYQTLPGPYAALQIPLNENPFASSTKVAYPTNAALAPYTDPYFRGFDTSFPDYDRFTEWQRDFTRNYANGGLPQLSFVRFMHDHTGNFSTAIDGVNTPELDQADNDYAVGLLVQQIANSQYKNNTLIFVIEDDSQDGADHVDSHRSIAFIVGPYVKQGSVVSTQYNTVDFVRTIEDVLGIGPLNLNDAVAVPMADVFDLQQTTWSFTATPSALLANTTLPITFPSSAKIAPRPTHNAAYWAKATAGMDFSAEDRFDFAQYNRILWQGLMGNKPYPAEPSGLDLRRDRAELLARYRKSRAQAPVESR